MKIYGVWGEEYADGFEHFFTTRELAEQFLDTRLRREYDKLFRDAGKAIPRQGYKDGHGGVVPQTHPYPGSFDEWCLSQGGGYIEELELLDALPARADHRMARGARMIG